MLFLELYWAIFILFRSFLFPKGYTEPKGLLSKPAFPGHVGLTKLCGSQTRVVGDISCCCGPNWCSMWPSPSSCISVSAPVGAFLEHNQPHVPISVPCLCILVKNKPPLLSCSGLPRLLFRGWPKPNPRKVLFLGPVVRVAWVCS